MLTGAVAVLVRRDGRDRAQPSHRGRIRRRSHAAWAGRAERAARPDAASAGAWRSCRSSASSGATSPVAAGRTTRRPARSPGSELAAGLREGDRLPAPIFTPSTKAESGHDEPISFDALVELVAARGRDAGRARGGGPRHRAAPVRPRSGDLRRGRASSSPTPSSSWASRTTGRSSSPTRSSPRTRRASGTRRPMRRAARSPRSTSSTSATGWRARRGTRPTPGPALPDDVVAGTRARYVEAFERITGASFARYLTEDVIAR